MIPNALSDSEILWFHKIQPVDPNLSLSLPPSPTGLTLASVSFFTNIEMLSDCIMCHELGEKMGPEKRPSACPSSTCLSPPSLPWRSQKNKPTRKSQLLHIHPT